MWVEFNNNPTGRTNAGDCAVRAISKALNIPWEQAYVMLSANGLAMGNIISANEVIASVLRENGFKRANVPSSCPDCYSIRDFAKHNTEGLFVVGTGNHIVTILDGDYYDVWNSGDETILYVWYNDIQPKF